MKRSIPHTHSQTFLPNTMYNFYYTVESEESVILGDVDGDGQITAMDASAILTYYVSH